MSRLLPCLLCGQEGREGRDVTVRLVEFAPDERRTVDVLLPVNHRQGAIEAPVSVPERYASIPRCVDVKACAERVATADLAAMAAAAPPPPAQVEPEPAEDPLAWL